MEVGGPATPSPRHIIFILLAKTTIEKNRTEMTSIDLCREFSALSDGRGPEAVGINQVIEKPRKLKYVGIQNLRIPE